MTIKNLRTKQFRENCRKTMLEMWKNTKYRKHMSEVHKGISTSQYQKETMSKIMKKNNPMFQSKIKKKASEWMKGNKNRYIDGRTKTPYPIEFMRITNSKKIQRRDNYTCQLCNDLLPIKALPSDSKKATLHHINYNKLDNRYINLITLCNFCNSSVNKNREEWTKYFQEKLNE